MLDQKVDELFFEGESLMMRLLVAYVDYFKTCYTKWITQPVAEAGAYVTGLALARMIHGLRTNRLRNDRLDEAATSRRSRRYLISPQRQLWVAIEGGE
jgi:hypothetical protein